MVEDWYINLGKMHVAGEKMRTKDNFSKYIKKITDRNFWWM